MVLRIFSILCMATSVYSQSNFNVLDYGAVGNGEVDDSKPFARAWKAVCGTTEKNATLVIPKGKAFLLNLITFEGPCKSNVQVQIDGDIVAPSNAVSDWKGDVIKWFKFLCVKALYIFGNGKFDAKGANWWKACPDMEGCTRPTTLAIWNCSKFEVRGLTSINSGKNHISVAGCDHGIISNVTLVAPVDSPNTDGINISESNNITVLDSIIATGDDCIAINTGSSYINIIGVRCGPGHGISGCTNTEGVPPSVGSLGINGEKAAVEQILVKDSTFNGTQNGVRIKTWQGGSGYARKISFKNIILFNSKNPIIIDQYYCPHKACNNQSAAVQISDVTYIDIKGTSQDEDAISFHCSQTVSCKNIFVKNVEITSVDANKKTYASCINAHGRSFASAPAVDCLDCLGR